MESADNDCSSVIIEPVYDSNLSAGLDAAHYYLGKSVKHSTRQQVRICIFDNKPCHGFFFFFFKLFFVWFSTTKFTVFGATSVTRTKWQNSEQIINLWLPVCPLL